MTDWQRTKACVSDRGENQAAAAVEWVVLVSGWSFKCDMWSAVVAGLEQQGMPSERILCIGWLELGRWLREPGAPCPLPSSALGARTVWVGWSLGGALVLEAIGCGKVRPLRALVISATPRHLAEKDVWPGVARGQWRSLHHRVRRDPVRALAEFDDWAGLAGENISRVTDPQDLIAGLDWLADIDQRSLLAEPPVPICWMFGTNDPLVPDVRWPERLNVGSANQWQVIPGAGHDVPWSQVAYVVSEII
jgi:pimeloyl-[acyl-carrier protein] methyl ester esterase